MEVCAAYRMPHSVFLAWPDSDRDKAIWQHLRERQTCPQCGTRAAEWDPNQGGHPGAYVPLVRRCDGCHVQQAAGKDVSDPATYVHLRPTGKVVTPRETPGRS